MVNLLLLVNVSMSITYSKMEFKHQLFQSINMEVSFCGLILEIYARWFCQGKFCGKVTRNMTQTMIQGYLIFYDDGNQLIKVVMLTLGYIF